MKSHWERDITCCSPAEAAYRLRRTLPGGHYALRDAERRLEREYVVCHENEKRLSKRLKRHTFNLREVYDFVNFVTKNLLRQKVVKISNKDVPDYAGGCYNASEKTIRMWFVDKISVITLIHELSHHIQHVEHLHGPTHGEEFVWAENVVFDALTEWGRERQLLFVK